jgi:hypothetical protein
MSVCMDAENRTATAIRSLDRPASSESPYRLRYPGPQEKLEKK